MRERFPRRADAESNIVLRIDRIMETFIKIREDLSYRIA